MDMMQNIPDPQTTVERPAMRMAFQHRLNCECGCRKTE